MINDANTVFMPMTAGELRGALIDLNLSNAEAAAFLGCSQSALVTWMREGMEKSPQQTAAILLRMLRSDPRLVARIRRAMTEPGSEAPRRKRGRPRRKLS